MVKEIAFYKIGPIRSIPIRPGPIQCVRNCASCILNPFLDDDPEAEEVIAFRSYENLTQRQFIWFAPYQSVQYHTGQIDILKRVLEKANPNLVLYIVALTKLEDCHFLRKVLSQEKLPACQSMDAAHLALKQKKVSGHYILPIYMPSCPINARAHSQPTNMINAIQLRDLLSPLVEHYRDTKQSTCYVEDYKVAAVPVAITKDNNGSSSFFNLGSICVQILEPYSLDRYVGNLKTDYPTGHLIQHLYYDLALNNAKLPTQLTAFLLLFLDRPEGITRHDLIEFTDWLRRSAMELNIHMAFTGKTEAVVDFGLTILMRYIHYDSKAEVYWPKDTTALMAYANIIVPNIVYYGLISRATLMLHNRDDNNMFQVKFSPDVNVQVMKDDLIELSQNLAESIDSLLPCRRPCLDVQSAIIDALSVMQTFGHYFKIKDALIRQNAGRVWAGDFDSDDEYYQTKRNDPAFKPWLIVSRRPYRLDRLNLFVNAVEPYLAVSNVTRGHEVDDIAI